MLSDASRASHGLYLRQGAKRKTPSERKSERAGCKSSTVLTTAQAVGRTVEGGEVDETPRSIEDRACPAPVEVETGDRAA